MRKCFHVLAIAVIAASCNQGSPTAEKSDSAAAMKADTTSYPYKAGYSSSFEIGKPENAKTVLDIWSAYENNKLDDTKGMWADSVTFQFDGFTFRGTADSALAAAKADRAMYSSVIDSVDAWIPLHSTDKNADWVAVWAREYSVSKKGKKDTADIHEIWMLKDGKARFISQYRAHRKP